VGVYQVTRSSKQLWDKIRFILYRFIRKKSDKNTLFIKLQTCLSNKSNYPRIEYEYIIVPLEYKQVFNDFCDRKDNQLALIDSHKSILEALKKGKYEPSDFCLYADEVYFPQIKIQQKFIEAAEKFLLDYEDKSVDVGIRSIKLDLEHISDKDDLTKRIHKCEIQNKEGNKYPLFLDRYGNVKYNFEVEGSKKIFHAIVYIIYLLTEKINETEFSDKHLKDAFDVYNFNFGDKSVNFAERSSSNYKKKMYRNSEHLELALECLKQQLLPAEITKIHMVISETKKTQTALKTGHSN